MSNKFDWVKLLIKYLDSIQKLDYVYSISSQKMYKLPEMPLGNKTTARQSVGFSLVEEKEIARVLLGPFGIQKWLYDLNYLIVGRNDSELHYHKPVIYMVMDKYKDRACSEEYKQDIARTYRQLLLLQFQGFTLWGSAYSYVDDNSSVIAERYKVILEKQEMFFQTETCCSAIPNSVNFENCTGGYYIHKQQDVSVKCKKGYYSKGG